MAYSLSRKIFILCIILFILALFRLHWPLDRFAAVQPVLVWPGWELWRLVLYPLASGGFLSLFAASITFLAPGEELEGMLGTRQFGLLLLMVVLGGALLHMVVFWGELVPMTGMINPVIFTLIGFVYLFPQSDLRVVFFNLRSWVVLAIVTTLALVEPTILVFNGQSAWILMTHGGFGILLGSAYFHARYQKYHFLLGPIRKIERFAARMWVPSGRSRSPLPQRVATQQPARIRIPFPRSAPREMSDEERLNTLLDKINEKSYDSLTEEERRFLDDYSNRL